MKFRHEWKHEIAARDCLVLQARLDAIARRDTHGDNGRYEVRSLYFDDPRDTALRVLEIETEIYDSWSREELDSYITLTERYLSAFKEKIKGL